MSATARNTVPSRFRILLVEDNPGDAELARLRLEAGPSPDFEIYHVTTLREALNAPHADAAILDLNLIDSTGIETLQSFRHHRPEIPVVVLSGFGDIDLRRVALREGAQDFIGKDEPVPRLVIWTILYAMERHHLSQQQRRIEGLVAASPDATVVADGRGIVCFANEAALDMFGKSRDRMIDHPFDYPVTPGTTVEIEIPRDGGTRTAELRAVEVDWDGTRATLVAIRDMTEQTQLRHQLQQSQKLNAIGRLAGGIAHDFNNLLTVVVNYGGFVRDSFDPSDPRREDIGEILAAADRAASLTGQLLAFSRRRIVQPTLVAPLDVVTGFHRMIRRTLPETIEFSVESGDSAPWPVFIDPVQFEQVLMNLAINAMDAMPNGGSIRVAMSNENVDSSDGIVPAGEYLELRMTDTGSGIAPEVIGEIFEPFFTTKPQGKGTGLGLATCYGIVRQAGGDIQVASEPGVGTTFSILLPHSTAAPDITEPAPDIQPGVVRGSETVMVVEDDPAVRESTTRILRRNGYRVLESADAVQALASLRETNEDVALVLTDVVMRSMGGRQLAERLAMDKPKIRVLLMTGYPDRAGITHRHGSRIALIAKPFTERDLLRKIREVLDRTE